VSEVCGLASKPLIPVAGFDGTVMSSINSMTQYQHFFGLQAASTSTSIVFVGSTNPHNSIAARKRLTEGHRVFTPLARSAHSSRHPISRTGSVGGGPCSSAILS
jgi:hypothetical protein